MSFVTKQVLEFLKLPDDHRASLCAWYEMSQADLLADVPADLALALTSGEPFDTGAFLSACEEWRDVRRHADGDSS